MCPFKAYDEACGLAGFNKSSKIFKVSHLFQDLHCSSGNEICSETKMLINSATNLNY